MFSGIPSTPTVGFSAMEPVGMKNVPGVAELFSGPSVVLR
jgi:hypothetical protein